MMTRRKRSYMQQQLHQQQQQGRDRISKLPDEILCEILSLLPHIEDAVKTSILSKRWKNLWTYAPVVQIRDICYYTPSNEKALFTKFVTAVFNRLQPGLRKLVLMCNNVYTKQWIDIVTNNKLLSHAATLKELELTLNDLDHLVKLPPNIFTSKNLVVLKLDFNVEQLASSPAILQTSSAPSSRPSVCLPRLKILHLNTGYVNYRMDVLSVQNVLKGCPVLEEFHLSGAMHDNMSLLIKSLSLKRLNLRVSCTHANRSIKIDTGNLEELDLRYNMGVQDGYFIHGLSLAAMTRVALDITSYDSPDLHPPIHSSVCGERLIRLLTKASSTKSLFLSYHAMVNLEYGGFSQQLPMFNKLMELKLGICSHIYCDILPWFLESAPNLVRLSIRSVNRWAPVDAEQIEYQDTPKCTAMLGLRHLEKVELVDIQRSIHEMKSVRYLLENAPVLKEMAFSFPIRRTKTVSWLRNRVCKVAKASPACRVTGLKATDPRNSSTSLPY